jgi:hypothetical protein
LKGEGSQKAFKYWILRLLVLNDITVKSNKIVKNDKTIKKDKIVKMPVKNIENILHKWLVQKK